MAYALIQSGQRRSEKAGWDLDHCELVWRVDEATVGTGFGSLPKDVRPGLVLGHGDRLAIAFPAERDIQVVSRPKSRAELQTQRSGRFQILFGPAAQMDLWGFWGLQKGTPEGDRFGHTVFQFLQGRLSMDSQSATPVAGAAVGRAASPTSGTSQALPDITPTLVAQARDFMEEWTHIVGQASDPVFWGALARFGRIGGAAQAPNAQAVLELPWRTWIEISKKANEIRDYELAARVFFFAYTMMNQVTFDADVSAACGFAHPSDESYREIARQALIAANHAPDGFSVVERSNASPVGQQTLQFGLAQLLGIDPTNAGAVESVEVSPAASGPSDTASPALGGPGASSTSVSGVDQETLQGLLHQLAGTCAEVMRLHGACDKTAESIQKARHVIDMPQAPASREAFLDALKDYEAEFRSLLGDLRTAIGTGQTLWSRALLVSGAFDPNAGDQGMTKVLMATAQHGGLQANEISSIAVGGLFLKMDFGSTMDSFYEADRRLAQVMGPAAE